VAFRLRRESRASAAHGAVVVISGRPPGGMQGNSGVSYPLAAGSGTAAVLSNYRYPAYMHKQLTGA
jgi:hypothetical protein